VSQPAKKIEPQRPKFCDRCRFEYPGELEKCPEDGSALRDLQADPLVGKVFAERYEIESVLGYGGMSMVYKARHTLMDRTVAIKILHPDYTKEPTALQRFQQESKAAASLNHQNVVTVYDFGCADGQAFFVMDCLEGKSLAQTIDEEGPLTYQRAVNVFKQVCDGLEAAHRKGIIHRDLKPGNLILMPQEVGPELVKIVDFGIAKMMPSENSQALRLTQTGEVFGSPIFMSPEQCLGKQLDTRSDIYSLGCVMYEALTGLAPLMGENFLETLNKHVGEKPKPFSETAPGKQIPEQIEEAVFKCLEKNPDDRFQTAGELRQALPDYGPVGGSSTGRGQTATQARTKQMITISLKTDSKVLTWVSGIALLLLAGIFGFMFLWPGPKDDSGTPGSKMIWTVSGSLAEAALNNHDYENAKKFVNFSEGLAEKFGDNHTRLLFSLNLDARILRASGQFDALKDVNTRINSLLTDKTVNDYKTTKDYLTGLLSSRDSIKKSLNAIDIQASIDRIIRVSGELEAAEMYREQEELLAMARDVFQKLNVQDMRNRAKLDLMLADCMTHRQHLASVRTLLLEATELFKASDTGMKSEDAVRAALALGVFDKDQSNYPAAKVELLQAIDLAEKYHFDKLKAACYGAYSDYFHQLKQEDLAKKYAAMAEQAAK
jgi:serine/threonine protein kinase